MSPHLKSIVDRLKRGEHVKGDDKSIYELTARQVLRVGNILRHFNLRYRQAYDLLSTKMGGEDMLRAAIADKSDDPRVVNFVQLEKRLRHNAIDKLEELSD